MAAKKASTGKFENYQLSTISYHLTFSGQRLHQLPCKLNWPSMQGPGDCQGRRPSLHSYLPRSCHPCAVSRSSPAICKSDAFKICSQLQMQTASDSHQFPHKKISEIKSTGTCRQSVRTIYIYIHYDKSQLSLRVMQNSI